MIRRFLVCLILILGTLALYWPVLHHSFLDPDADACATAKAQISTGLTAASGEWALRTRDGGNWQPVTWLSHMLDCLRHGLNPRGHHLTNILLHATNGALVFLLLLQLTRAFLPSAFIAALFAWHPLQVENVAWIAQRRELLGGFFGLFGLLCYGVYARRGGSSPGGGPTSAGGQINIRESRDDRPGVGRVLLCGLCYALALLCFALGVSSNPMLLLLPLVFLLLDFWPYERFRAAESRAASSAQAVAVLEKLPFLAIAAGAGWMQWLARNGAAAQTQMEPVPLLDRAGQAVIREVQWLAQLFWPIELIPVDDATQLPALREFAIAASVLVVLTFLAVALARTRPTYPTGWFWHLVLVFPAAILLLLGLAGVPAGGGSYLALVGALIMVVGTAWHLAADWAWLRWLLVVLLPACIAGCVFLTARELPQWKDMDTLLRHTLALAPGNFTAGQRLVAQLNRQGKVQEALVFTAEAARRGPGNIEAQCLYGETLARFGDTTHAMDQFEAVLKINPGHARAHRALATLLTAAGRTDEAIDHMEAALNDQPRNADARHQLGVLLKLRKRNDEAAIALQRAIQLQPDHADARFELGSLLLSQGKPAAAREHLEVAVREKPVQAVHERLADACRQMGDADAAIMHYLEAIRLGANSAVTHYQLALLLDAQGQEDLAAAQYIAALEVDPQNPEGHLALARILRRQGRMDLCLQHLQDAADQKPDVFETANLIAWIRATHPDPQYRKGSEALRFSAQAIRLATTAQMPVALDSLAAAYAEVGRFADAVRMAEKAAAQAIATTNAPLADAVNARLRLYRANKSFQEQK